MRVSLVVLAMSLMLSTQTVSAQDRDDSPVTTGPASEATTSDLLPAPDQERVEELRAELKALLEQSREGAEGMVREFQSSTGLTDSQVYGIAAGIVVGALLADMIGGGGLATITLATGGAALGNWIMSE